MPERPTKTVPTGWPSASAGPATPVSASPTSACNRLAAPTRHFACRLCADHRPGAYPQQCPLHVLAVGDDSTGEPVCWRPGLK